MHATNIILHWIAHFRDKVTKTEARPSAKMLETEAEAKMLASRPAFTSLPSHSVVYLHIPTGLYYAVCLRSYSTV